MRILIISSQQPFRQQVQAACLRFPNQVVSLRTAESIGQGIELASQFEAQIVFLDLTRNIEAGMLAIGQLAAVSNRMVAVSVDKLTTDFMTRAIRAGAREVLSQPVQDDEVHEIIIKTQAQLDERALSQPARNGKVVMCFSSKGGVGKTTISTNLAITLQQRLGDHKVALIDANTQAPNIAPMLDLRPERWLRDAVEEYRRLDSELLVELMTVHPSSGLHVLPHSTDNPLGLDFSEDQLSKILLVSKGTFEWTIVDTFPILSTLNLSMMDLCDEILVVTEAVVPSLRSARHNMQMLEKAGFGQNRIKLIVNRYTKFKGNVPPDLVSETLGWPVSLVVPYDMHATISANNGKPVTEMFPDRPISNAVNELADTLMGIETEPLKEGLIARNVRGLRNLLDM